MEKDVARQDAVGAGLLGGVAAAARILLTPANPDQPFVPALETIGLALDVDRICVFEAPPDAQAGDSRFSRRYEWVRDPAAFGAGSGPESICFKEQLPRWHALLAQEKAICSHVRDLPPEERAFLEPLGVKSLLAIPVHGAQRSLGLICFHQCRCERDWPAGEQVVLQTLAACLSGAILRRNADQSARSSVRKEMEESLRASERQLRTIVDKLPVGVWLTDAQGRIILCNQAGERIWGGARLTGIEQYGQATGWWHGTGRRILPHEWAPVRALARGETYVNEVVDIEVRDGYRKTIAHSAIPVRDDANRITGIVVINEDITERMRAQTRLRESEERHRRITAALSDYVYTVWIQDGRPVATEHGEACAAVTGYTRDDLAANPYLWLRMVVEEDKAAVLEQGRRLLAGQNPGPVEHRIVRKDGRTRWVRNTPVPHCDAQGKFLHYDGVIQDITDRREAEDALRLTQFAMDHCSIPVFWIGPSGRFLYVNEAAAQSLAYPREQLLYLGVPDVNPDFPVDRWPAHWTELKRQKILHWEGRHRRQDGRVFPVEITANYLEFNGREYDFAFARDISEQRQDQDKVRQSQEMLQLVLDHIPQRVFWKGRDFRYLGGNKTFLQDAGFADVGGILGRDDFELSWKDHAAAYRTDDKAVMEDDRPKLGYEEPQPKPDGSVKWLKTNKLPLHDKDGRVIGVLGAYEDVTRHKEAEESLRLCQFAVDNCSIAAHWVDPQGRFLYVNDAACRALGYSRQELLELHVWDVDAAMPPSAWAGFWQRLREQRNVLLETRERAKDGRLFPVEINCSYLEYDGKERGFAFVQDITERKRSEEAQGS